MKAVITTLAMLFAIANTASAQISIKETLKFKDTVKVDRYKVDENGFEYKKIRMSPGEHTILNPEDIDFLKQQTIIRVDLVYSDYPVGADFSELNRKRILELYILLPEAFNKGIIKWNLLKQTGVKSASDMQNHFHGFVIYYRPMPTFEEEHKELSDVINGRKPPSDSTLLKVFGRQSNWKNMLVVMDVTGSMSPYTAQLLLWIKANQKLNTFKQIVFFNDNEENSNNQTKSKDTSGIWTIDSGNSNKVIAKAVDAMFEGKHIENDLEAICFAINQYPENKGNVVLVADNWENPCDMELLEFLKQQKVPVKIVICGVTDRLNTLYLDIAYATGGSIHTMEEDLTTLATLGDGKTFKLAGLKFRMTNGKFVQI